MGSEPPGAAARALLHVWVLGDRADEGFSGDRLEVIADRDAYAVGDVARLLVVSPVGARPFLSTVEGPRLLAYDTVRLGGADDRASAAVVEVKVGPEHVPNLFVGVALVDRGNLVQTTKMLRVPPVDRLLRPVVSVEGGRTEAEPGTTVPMSVRVTDASGAPAAGVEVAVAIVDEALHALYGDPAAPIEPVLPSSAPQRREHRRADPRPVRGVVRRAPEAGRRGAAPGRRRRSPRRRDAPPTGGEPADAADAVPVDGAPGRGRARSPTPPRRAASPGGGPSPRRRSTKTTRSHRDGEDSPGKKSKGDGGGEEGPLSTRADFRTMIGWWPAVRTGPDGTRAARARDHHGRPFTRWRMTARAVDAGTRVGTGVSTLRVTKPVVPA